MTNTVFDTTVVAYANGDLAGRKRGNALDTRLCAIEAFLCGRRVAWYNTRLEDEYRQKMKVRRNDVIEAFFIRLADHGRRALRNGLTRQRYACAITAGWPSHDQHLLAAACEATDPTILVTEKALTRCAAKIRREFGIDVRML